MSTRARLRYRFDNLMARGVGAQVLLLAVVTLVLVVIAAAAALLFGARPDPQADSPSFGQYVWISLMHSLDAGAIGGDGDVQWPFLTVMLVVTVGGLFVLSALIGVLNQGFGEMLEGLRRGRSAVVERGHTVVLGWNPKIFTLLQELAEANRNQRHATVVVLADRDKVEMDAEIAAVLAGSRMRVVTRRGNPMTVDDLRLVGLADSKAVVVLTPEGVTANEADTVVLKTLLAIRKVVPAQSLHLVAELRDPRTEPVARLVVGERAALVQSGPLISRLLVQTGRQPGLSAVYTELLDFAGVEIYVTPQPQLTGRTFREALFGYGTSALIGVRTAAGALLLPPDAGYVLADGDQVVVISEDDDKILLDGSPEPDAGAIRPVPPAQPPTPETTLVLGSSDRLPLVLQELDGYVADGSTALVVGEVDPSTLLAGLDGSLRHLSVKGRPGDVTDRDLLESLDVARFDHVLLLSETADRSQEMADARTTVALLYLRAIEQDTRNVPVTSEILEISSRDLASVGDADDFIVSNRLVSLVVSQLAENPRLVQVLDELFRVGGHQLYIKPAADYVLTGREVDFATVCEAALRRDEIAIGHRLGEQAHDADHGYGVVLNPAKRSRRSYRDDDRIVVLARG